MSTCDSFNGCPYCSIRAQIGNNMASIHVSVVCVCVADVTNEKSSQAADQSTVLQHPIYNKVSIYFLNISTCRIKFVHVKFLQNSFLYPSSLVLLYASVFAAKSFRVTRVFPSFCARPSRAQCQFQSTHACTSFVEFLEMLCVQHPLRSNNI